MTIRDEEGGVWIPKVDLRFIKRDGRFVLQQLHGKVPWTTVGGLPPQPMKWFDVPLAKENHDV